MTGTSTAPRTGAAPKTYVRPLDAVDTIDSVETVGEPGADARLLVRARKTVTASDPYMAGHFPVVTLYPAVFFLEGVRQCVGLVLAHSPRLNAHVWGDHQDDWLEIDSLRSLRVLKPMRDGDALQLEISVSADDRPGAVRAKVDCRRGGPTGPLVVQATVALVRGGGAV
ncbi:hypothetical protein AAW14_18840 [Streptomyces hygroscopicus]|uniref:hypothetical protein n=1 Tax=Streptomyces hygroscopicus TaxID=1912 RepID=UPI0022406033|nr:hypothetical protein [Streptomyces hygroscopicus]MCW7944045.1 hypothetical protein [Streptomyces hygroscopicus]